MMPVNFRVPEGPKHPVPEGTFQAVCNGVWDIGLQETTFKGVTKMKYQIIIQWELNETINDPEDPEKHGNRYVIRKKYNNIFSNRASLKIDLEAWRGKAFTPPEIMDFNIENLVGANCLLQITRNETESGTYSNITGVMKMPKGTPKITPNVSADAPDWIVELQTKGRINESAQKQTSPEPPPPTEEPTVVKCAQCGLIVDSVDKDGYCDSCSLPF